MANRQEIMSINSSIRIIKNELEKLLEKEALSDSTFDSINSLLPAETSLSSNLTTPVIRTPETNNNPFPRKQPPSQHISNLSLAVSAPPPPAYSQTSPPALPARNPAPTPPPQKPVLAQARALYEYEENAGDDLAFQKDDRIDVYEYVNDEWWLGKNLRTGAEGIFPANRVLEDTTTKKSTSSTNVGVATATLGNVGGSSTAPEPQRPQANREGSSNMNSQGKKFGKKLGNAAVFGAGATIGSKLVNSIF